MWFSPAPGPKTGWSEALDAALDALIVPREVAEEAEAEEAEAEAEIWGRVEDCPDNNINPSIFIKIHMEFQNQLIHNCLQYRLEAM